jgi:glucose-1-phosphatase
MKVNLTRYNTIIFDFGGVILDIDPELSRQSFIKLYSLNKLQELEQSGLLVLFEKGTISKQDMIKELEKITETNNDPDSFIKAWCAMLLEYQPPRIEWIKKLGKTHRLLMLSNTNELHFECFSNKLKREFGITFTDLFDKVYLSHEMHLLKPGLEIFQRVIDEQQLIPERTLFIEDTAENAQAANQLGIQTLVIPRNGKFYDYFEEE